MIPVAAVARPRQGIRVPPTGAPPLSAGTIIATAGNGQVVVTQGAAPQGGTGPHTLQLYRSANQGTLGSPVQGATSAGDAGAAAWTVVNGFLNVPLTAAEVTGGEIALFIEDQDGSAFLDRVVKILVVGYDPRATPASTTQIAGAVGDALSARLAS
ncbi:MAG TPA: hypothetical protein VGV85_03325 [Longimicrobiaceae bacterium]|nr:hypothetical protein [Longimicrobiaceae bacterium]